MIAAALGWVVALVVVLCGTTALVLHRALPRRLSRYGLGSAPAIVSGIVSVVSAVCGGAAIVAFGASWEALAYVFLGLLGVQLADIDLRTRMLPNRLVAIAAIGTSVFLALSAGTTQAWGRFGVAVICGAGTFVLYLVLALLSGGGMGAGDVKLAGVIGLGLGYQGLVVAFAGTLAAFILGAIGGLLLMLFGKAGRRTHVPFGPAIVLGAAFALVAARLATSL